MLRRWLSEFISKNRDKIRKFIEVLFISVVLVLILYLIVYRLATLDQIIPAKRIEYGAQHSIISGPDTTQDVYEADSKIIDTFIKHCNNSEIQEAYNLLTDDCKKNLYPSLNDFSEKYCKKYFSEKRDYNLQSWVNRGNCKTYQVRIMTDALATGTYDNNKIYQDYITVVEENGTSKININSYIIKQDINKATQKDGITIKAIQSDTYLKHEIYSLEVTNNTNNTILLDYMQDPTNTLMLVTRDDSNFSVRPDSINYTKLILESGQIKDISISFDKSYTFESEPKYILFSKIVTNYNEFIKNKETYTDLLEIKVDL